MEIGARFGILDDLEVGAVVLPLEFSPDFAYGNPRLEAKFRFLKAPWRWARASGRSSAFTRATPA